MQRVLIAGGSGFVGDHLRRHLLALYTEVFILTTNPKLAKQSNHILWNPAKREITLNNSISFDAVVNLAGANIGSQYWTKKRKQELIESRTDSVNFLADLIREKKIETNYVLQASAIGIYGDRGMEKLTEESQHGTGFMAQIVQAWESAALNYTVPNALLRIGIVFHPAEGAYSKLIQGLRYRICVIFGLGRHYHSWIDIDDLCRLIVCSIQEGKVGVYNAVNPQPIQNIFLLKRYMKKYGGLSIPLVIPLFLIRFLLGDFSELLLSSQRVSSRKLQSEGFQFQVPNLKSFFKKYKKK